MKKVGTVGGLLVVCLAVGDVLAGFELVVGNGQAEIQAQVVNVDFNLPALGRGFDQTHSGDDGFRSSPGGIVWNGISSEPQSSMPLMDEFGAQTQAAIAVLDVANTFTEFSSPNELQDSGLSTGGIQTDSAGGGANAFGQQTAFNIEGLLQSEIYNLVIYVSGSFSNNRVNVVHAGGTSTMDGTGFPGFSLPGLPGADYLLFSGLFPVLLNPGPGYGLIVELIEIGIDSTQVGGFQISGVFVPEPSTISLLFLGAAVAGWRRRACNR